MELHRGKQLEIVCCNIICMSWYILQKQAFAQHTNILVGNCSGLSSSCFPSEAMSFIIGMGEIRSPLEL